MKRLIIYSTFILAMIVSGVCMNAKENTPIIDASANQICTVYVSGGDPYNGIGGNGTLTDDQGRLYGFSTTLLATIPVIKIELPYGTYTVTNINTSCDNGYFNFNGSIIEIGSTCIINSPTASLGFTCK